MNNKYLALLKANADKCAGTLRAESKDDGEHIYMMDVIDSYWGVSAKMLIEAMSPHAGKTIHLHINSPGGDVFESIAMASAIAAHDGDVITHIDGVAASAATRVALAAREVRIADSGMLMIHNAWTITLGDKSDHAARIELLDKIDVAIAADYTRKTGKPLDQIVDWMNAETWFTAEEAKEHGFVDQVFTTTKANKNKAWDLSAYQNAPKPKEQPQDVAEIADAQRAHNARRLRLLQLT